MMEQVKQAREEEQEALRNHVLELARVQSLDEVQKLREELDNAREKAQASDGLQQQLNDKSQELPNAFFALAQQAQAHVGTANMLRRQCKSLSNSSSVLQRLRRSWGHRRIRLNRPRARPHLVRSLWPSNRVL